MSRKVRKTKGNGWTKEEEEEKGRRGRYRKEIGEKGPS